MDDRKKRMTDIIHKAISIDLARVLLNGDIRDRELSKNIPEGTEVIDLIMAGIVYRKSNCLRVCRDAVDLLAEYVKEGENE